MTMLPAPPIERRALPGTSLRFSAVTVALDPPAVAPPAADARTVALLRRARERGITTFDVARARFPARAERLIATAFTATDPDLAVIVGRSIETLASEHGPSDARGSTGPPAEALEASLEQSRRRLAPVPLMVLEWDPGRHEETPKSEPPIPFPATVGASPPDLFWAYRLSSVNTVLPPVPRPPPLFAGEFSLLEDGVAPLFDSAPTVREARLIARNPFGDGRLDGSRFAATMVPGEPGHGPVDVRRLHAEFDPVLRLGFLTQGRRRTLAQAALHFVLRWPWVATCVIPLPTPERFDEILGYASSPPLDEDDLERWSRVK
jgi:aryl-alcohol dehydrogenase-like predicted oxidoreductase